MQVYLEVILTILKFIQTLTMKLLVTKKKYSIIGRGIGAGFQFNFFEYFTLDIIGGVSPTKY